MTFALRSVLDVSCETKINHQSFSCDRHRLNHLSFFSWGGQYLVMLEGDTCCYAHCAGRFVRCDYQTD